MFKNQQIIVFSPFYISPHFSAEQTQQLLLDLKQFLKNIHQQKHHFSQFFLIDDGNSPNIKEILLQLQQTYPWLNIHSHTKNIGLDQSLFQTYNFLLEKNHLNESDIIIRLDADGEHDPSFIPTLIEKINAGNDVALCQIQYHSLHQQEFDLEFNTFQGALQGEIILGKGKKLLHNSPGFSAYTLKVLHTILPEVPNYLQRYELKYHEPCKWGADLVLLFHASLNHFHIDTTSTQPSLLKPANRSIAKMLDQLRTNTQHLQLMLELNSKPKEDPNRKKN